MHLFNTNPPRLKPDPSKESRASRKDLEVTTACSKPLPADIAEHDLVKLWNWLSPLQRIATVSERTFKLLSKNRGPRPKGIAFVDAEHYEIMWEWLEQIWQIGPTFIRHDDNTKFHLQKQVESRNHAFTGIHLTPCLLKEVEMTAIAARIRRSGESDSSSPIGMM